MRIIIACGGSGGHLFCGLSLWAALKKRKGSKELLLVIDEKARGINFDLHTSGIVLKLARGVFQNLKVLLEFKPQAVIGFGGRASFFAVFFARILGIKTLIFEPNLLPGRANRLLAYCVKMIAVGFAPTKEYFGARSFKVKLTGIPLRPHFSRNTKEQSFSFLRLAEGKFTILVMGGSQGSRRINREFLSAINLLPDKSGLQIIHLCGSRDLEFLESAYKDSAIKARIFTFLSEIEYAYSAADLVICRAGALSINELAYFGLPAILIPYPYAAGHQGENARYLWRHNAAVLIEEKELAPQILKEKILDLINRPQLREALGRNIRAFSTPAAAEALADLVLNE